MGWAPEEAVMDTSRVLRRSPRLRALTGTLANGDPFSLPFPRQSSAHLILVPEPSTCLLLGAGLVALSRSRRGARRADGLAGFPAGG
jgi:hypothetical protein